MTLRPTTPVQYMQAQWCNRSALCLCLPTHCHHRIIRAEAICLTWTYLQHMFIQYGIIQDTVHHIEILGIAHCIWQQRVYYLLYSTGKVLAVHTLSVPWHFMCCHRERCCHHMQPIISKSSACLQVAFPACSACWNTVLHTCCISRDRTACIAVSMLHGELFETTAKQMKQRWLCMGGRCGTQRTHRMKHWS